MSITTYRPVATLITCRDDDEQAVVTIGAYRELERENVALREDKERLIGQLNLVFSIPSMTDEQLAELISKCRAVISRKEAQP